MSDTAVLEQVTADPVVETPPPAEAAPETTATATPETEAPATPETVKGIDQFTPEELADHPVFKDALARREESVRRSEEARQAREFRTKAAQFAPQARAWVQQEFKRATENGEDPDWSKVENAFGWFRAGEADLQYTAYKNALLEFLPPSDAVKFEAAENRYIAGKSNEETFWKEAVALGVDAAIQKRMPELRKQWEAEQKKTAAAASEAQAVIDGDVASREQARPTNSRGDSPVAAGSPDVLAALRNSGREGGREAFKRKHGFYPD